jgi:sugar transferase (PEP-CTERM/EpsH1 system associated)
MADILFLAHRIPYPPNKGDKIRSWHILEHLARQHRVHLGCFIDDEDDWQHVPFLQSICASAYFQKVSPLQGRLRSLTGLISGAPLSVVYYADKNFDAWVGRTLASQPVESVFLFSSAMGQFMTGRGKPDVPVVMDFVDVDSDKWAQYAKTSRWPMSWVYARESKTLEVYERKLAAIFSAGVFVSEQEADHFRKLAPESRVKIHALNNGVDYEKFSPAVVLSSPFRVPGLKMVFTGAMDYWANVDGVDWFARQILPLVRQKFPDATFYIVGGKPARAVKELERLPGVVVTGSVPDVRPYLAYGDVVVCPLRIARGIQNKVLEGMAMGKAVVATEAAFDGINAQVGPEIAVANSAVDFATQVIRLADGRLAAEMGRLARARIQADYGWKANLAILDKLLAQKNCSAVTASQPFRKINEG